MTLQQFRAIQLRRDFLKNVASGIGMAALGDLLASDGLTAANLPDVNPLAPSSRTSRPRRSTSSSCSWKAARASTNSSIRSLRWRSIMARPCRSR